MTIEIIEGDCLEVMKELPDQSIDMVLCDLPYGTTSNKWDAVIPFEPLWREYKRLCKGAIVLTASQPFTSALVMSNPKAFKHEWIWIKNRGSNFANTVREPMKEHESALVFAYGKWTYHKQMQERTGSGGDRVKYGVAFKSQSENYREFEGREHQQLPELRVPSSWQKFNTEVGLHPTQKPVPLFEYLIRTYTDEGQTVLDNTMGSGTTGTACLNTGRNFIGIEKDPVYFGIAERRLGFTPVDQETDKYGNREGELKYCCFPDCGCDGARLCMAEEGPSKGSQQLNLEKRTITAPVYEANHNKRK